MTSSRHASRATALTATSATAAPNAPTARTSSQAPADGLVDALVQASFVTMAVLTRVGADNDLSLTQLRVLAILRDHTPAMGELADHLGLERSTLSGLVDRAERRGLLRRIPNPHDRRGVAVGLTPEGVRLGDMAYDQVAEGLSPLFGDLVDTDRVRLRRLLERVVAQPPPTPDGRGRSASRRGS